ncbi:hypothetical protein CC1G_12982 [Coprinopsis cinerea okayama7|uniref:Uncharacterized protein n=1 Tax=Coprinopsis cinerea (strain Okayama-7 / 130 / ATCC MYA-4618 / FGSC 9003) TaxID=240176 RepID=A8PHK9_COPC7|nr:hypothetical protein CC1G_12982 [Coprinopsis cinerea okayama7\|eukprot:XP_001841425.2 hypothetical protein CC1G_12982 [Coprinopsis cinerea okayama7\
MSLTSIAPELICSVYTHLMNTGSLRDISSLQSPMEAYHEDHINFFASKGHVTPLPRKLPASPHPKKNPGNSTTSPLPASTSTLELPVNQTKGIHFQFHSSHQM